MPPLPGSRVILICGRLTFPPAIRLSYMGDQLRIYETLSQNQILPTNLKPSNDITCDSEVQVNDRRVLHICKAQVSSPTLNKQSIKSQDLWVGETQDKEPREGNKANF